MEAGYEDFNDSPVAYSFLGFGEIVTENTVNKMIETIKVSSKNLRIRNKAASIVIASGVEPKDKYGEVDAIYQWVMRNTHYLKDPDGTEMIQSPLVALDQIESGRMYVGDCDCLTILILSLLKSIGYPVALRIAAYKSKRFQHVYGLVNINGEWIPVEPIVTGKYIGWEAPDANRIRDYKV